MLTLALLLSLQASPAHNPPPQECVSAYGKSACGYNCVAAYGDLQCAAHPEATCRAAYGTIACGFDCVAAYGTVKCAEAPGGVCQAAYGQVVCSEAAAYDWRRERRPRDGRRWGPTHAWPQQECKSAYGKTACGYGCVAAYGDVRCSEVPGGMCQASYGEVVCSGG